MILALLLAVAADPYAVVTAAEYRARDCEARVIGEAYLAPVKSSIDDLHAEARRACAVAWDEHVRARLAYFRVHSNAVKRQVPSFRPDVEACWNAFDAERNQWPGAPKNTALEECKNAKD